MGLQRPPLGADDLAGLVYIDGGSGPSRVPARRPRPARMQALDVPNAVTVVARSAGSSRPLRPRVQRDRISRRVARPQCSRHWARRPGLLPKDLVPPVRVTNAAEYGYALNCRDFTARACSPGSATSAPGLTTTGALRGWNGAGAATPITGFETMFSGAGMHGRRRHRVVLPAAADRRHAGRRQRQRYPAQSRPRSRPTMGHDLPKSSPDLRLWRAPRRRGSARGAIFARPAVRDTHEEPDIGELGRAPTRTMTRRACTEQRLLQRARAVPEEGRVDDERAFFIALRSTGPRDPAEPRRPSAPTPGRARH